MSIEKTVLLHVQKLITFSMRWSSLMKILPKYIHVPCFLCLHCKGGIWICPLLRSENYVTKLEKWGHLCHLDIFHFWFWIPLSKKKIKWIYCKKTMKFYSLNFNFLFKSTLYVKWQQHKLKLRSVIISRFWHYALIGFFKMIHIMIYLRKLVKKMNNWKMLTYVS